MLSGTMRAHSLRENFDAIFYVVQSGCPQGKLRWEAVVATVSASVDADCDNGGCYLPCCNV
jgi:hypothetical protein